MADQGIKASDLSAAVASIVAAINAMTKAIQTSNSGQSAVLQATTQNIVTAIYAVAAKTT